MAPSLTANEPAGLCSQPSSVLPSKICLHLGQSAKLPGGPGLSTAPPSAGVETAASPGRPVGSLPPEPPVALAPPVPGLPPVPLLPPVAGEPALPPSSPVPPVSSIPPVPPTMFLMGSEAQPQTEVARTIEVAAIRISGFLLPRIIPQL